MRTTVLGCHTPADAIQALKRRGMRTLLLPPHPLLPPPVASHPDLLLFFAKDAVYTTRLYRQIADRECRVISHLTGLEIRTVEQELGGVYPNDILFDAAPVGPLLFCLPAHTSPELTHLSGIRTVPVRQGYAKCSVLPVGNHAMVTADRSIASAARAEGVDVLVIRPGHILLPGYDTGFIGGASSFAPYENLQETFFCGDPMLHPDGQETVLFCSRYGFETIALTDRPLTDIGTILII